jgi:hypothetical protein
VNANPTPQLFTEVFPIRTDAIPPLYAFRIRLTDEGLPLNASGRAFGGKLAYRLRASLPGVWVWGGARLLTDVPPDAEALTAAVAAARHDQPKVYHWLAGIDWDDSFTLTPEHLARYVVRGLLPLLDDKIAAALASTTFPIKHAHVERDFRALPHVVEDQAALSLSVVSRVIYDKTLADYIATAGKATALLSLTASDHTSSLQGVISKIVGQVREHRSRLIALSQRESMRALIAAAPDDSWVLRIDTGHGEYDYVAEALRLIIRLEDVHRYDVHPAQIEKALHLKPVMRANIVKIAADVVKEAGWIGSAFSVQNAPSLFRSETRELELVYAGGRSKPYQPETTAANVQSIGAFWQPERFQTEPIRVVVINTLAEGAPDFLEALRRAMERDFHIGLEVVRERNMRVITQANLDSAARLVQKETFDLALVFLADEADSLEEDSVEARYAKEQTIGRGMPCLTIHESTLNKPENTPDLILGMVARAGCVPFTLRDPDGKPPRYGDLVIGMDCFTHLHKDQRWLTGIARLYQPDGRLLRGIIAQAPYPEDSAIPDSLLARLLPPPFVQGKRVIMHYNGLMDRDFLRAVGGWEAEVDATFYPVEIMRQGVPRLYALQAGRIESAPRGTIFRLSATEAFLLASSSPFDATPQPLHLRADPALTIETAVRSVLDFSLLHYGALKPPKLPVTTHNADFIADGIQRGLLLRDGAHEFETALPFWL